MVEKLAMIERKTKSLKLLADLVHRESYQLTDAIKLRSFTAIDAADQMRRHVENLTKILDELVVELPILLKEGEDKD